MTPKELLQRLQTYIKALVWTAGNKIFGENVFIVSAFPALQLSQLVAPTCFIVDSGQQSHPEHNNIIDQNFSILLFVEHVGNNMGEYTIIGGNRIANKSSGAGLLDIEGKILQGLREETVLSTAKIVFLSKSRAKNALVKGANPSMTRSLNFSARVDYV